MDLIENFVKTGGIDGNKMSVDRLYQQANGFITQKKGKTLEVMKKIAAESVLNDHVIESCKGHEIIDNVLMTFLVIVPGHALPVHYDVPLFKNIPKENAPGKHFCEHDFLINSSLKTEFMSCLGHFTQLMFKKKEFF